MLRQATLGLSHLHSMDIGEFYPICQVVEIIEPIRLGTITVYQILCRKAVVVKHLCVSVQRALYWLRNTVYFVLATGHYVA